MTEKGDYSSSIDLIILTYKHIIKIERMRARERERERGGGGGRQGAREEGRDISRKIYCG